MASDTLHWKTNNMNDLHDEVMKKLKEAIEGMAGEDGDVANVDYDALANVAISLAKDYLMKEYE